MTYRCCRRALFWILLVGTLGVPFVVAQPAQTPRGSRNVAVLSHLTPEALGGAVGDIELDEARPFAYLARKGEPGGLVVVSLADPAQPVVVFSWTMEAGAARDVKSFRLGDRTFVVLAVQHEADPSLGALLFDVTGLSEGSPVKEIGRVEGADGGFLNLFPYRHSDGRALLFATGGGDVLVYDLARVVAGEASSLVARMATPEQLGGGSGYDNLFVGYEPESGQDRFYGAGAGGYYVFDVTDLAAPTRLTAINSAAVQRGQAIVPTPDGRYAVTAAEYRTSPLRIFDLQLGLDGSLKEIRTAVGAWTADWRNFAQQFEVRWPYVFVAALHDGLQVFNMRDPVNPYTYAFYRTYTGPPGKLADRAMDLKGAWDLDVRNADGLIAVSDGDTGLWLFALEAFEGWDGRSWGLPNVSSVQDW